MRILGQIGRLSPWSDEKLDGNAYLGLTALMGAIGWGYTAYVVHFETPPPKGVVRLQNPEWLRWVQSATSHSWELIWIWVGLFVALLAVSIPRLERGALLSAPAIIWSVGMATALGANAYALDSNTQWLVWMPWLVLFTVGYLATGLLVTRGWIYLVAGVVSGLLTLNGVYGVLTNSGCLVITLDPVTETPLAGAVLLPMPLTYVVLGVLHVVPLAVDALMGGREMTDEGIPKVKAERLGGDDDEVGGVVPD